MRQTIGNRQPESAYRISLPGVPTLETPDENRLFSKKERQLLDQMEQWRASGLKILLYPCYLAPYKQIPYLLEAVRLLKSRETSVDFRLVLTVDEDSREYFPCRDEVMRAVNACPPETVLLTGSLSRAAMAEAYRRSDILVFPSLVETLGLPLLEAMAFGLPVVAVDAGKPDARQGAFAREICGEAALYADPSRPDSFAECLGRLLADEDLCFSLAAHGQARCEGLSWAGHAREILD